jgi:glycosyltransferase involved in cell wall biosynthesis
MHIAYLTPEYPGPKTGNSGGLGTSILNLAHALIHEGISVSIFVYGQDADEQYVESGINFYRIKNVQLKGLSWWLTRKKLQHIINEAITKTKIDILEVPDWTGISAWMNINCSLVMRLHGSDSYFCHLEKRPVKWWNKLQEKTAYKNADAIIAVSDYVGSVSNEIFGIKRKYSVIHNGIDLSIFQAEDSTNNEPVIFYFGTLIRKKGVLNIPHIFNKVIEQMPGARLILAGADARDIQTGSSSTWALMQLLFSLKALPNVAYVGKKPYHEIRNLIEQAQVCIFPSYAEALPVSWLEAMAMGKAIVASDIGWANEMLTHEKEALLCHPSQHETFASHIIRFLQNTELRKTLGTNARKRVEQQFDNQIVAQQNIEFYTSVLKNQEINQKNKKVKL